jgi:hypothetical protein
MPILQKGFAVEQRLTVLVAIHNVFPAEQAASFQPDTVDQPGRNSCYRDGKIEAALSRGWLVPIQSLYRDAG